MLDKKTITGKVLNYTNYVQITQWCNISMVIDLCFHAGDNREVNALLQAVSCLLIDLHIKCINFG